MKPFSAGEPGSLGLVFAGANKQCYHRLSLSGLSISPSWISYHETTAGVSNNKIKCTGIPHGKGQRVKKRIYIIITVIITIIKIKIAK